jgi:hypothetical protein
MEIEGCATALYNTIRLRVYLLAHTQFQKHTGEIINYYAETKPDGIVFAERIRV